MKKLLVLLGILAAFSFVACNKEAGGSDPETNIENEDTGDNGAVEDEGTTGGDSTEDEGTTGGDSTEDEGSTGDDSAEDETKNETIFAKGTLSNNGYGDVEVMVEDGVKVAHIVGKDWNKAALKLDEPINIEGKKVKLTAKAGSNFTGGPIKLIFATDDTHQSEMAKNATANVDFGVLTNEYKEFIGSESWTAYQIDNPADLSNITKILISSEDAKGDYYIKNIEFVD